MFDLFLGSFLNAIIDPVRYIMFKNVVPQPTSLYYACICLLLHTLFTTTLIVTSWSEIPLYLLLLLADVGRKKDASAICIKMCVHTYIIIFAKQTPQGISLIAKVYDVQWW